MKDGNSYIILETLIKENKEVMESKYSFLILSENNDQENNEIQTSKFTLWNFLPKILFEHFTKQINLYFLWIIILQVF